MLETYFTIHDVEDHPVSQRSARSLEDEPYLALQWLFLREMLHLDVCRTVYARPACLCDGDVLTFYYLNLSSQVLTVILLALGRDLLDSGTDQLGLIAHHQGVTKLLVENHPVGAVLPLLLVILTILAFLR